MMPSSDAGQIGLYDIDVLDHADGVGQTPAATISRLLALACTLTVLVMLVAEWNRYMEAPLGLAAAAPALAAAPARAATLAPQSASLVPMPAGVPSAHASSMAALPGGGLMVFWWAGSRESGPDVKVYSARFERGQWSGAREVASRESLGAALGFGVRRIGNPVAWTGPDGSIHLYVVATGLGGWAASRVVQMVSTDGGQRFKTLRVLPLSPLFNTSVLVRAAPVPLPDGGWWLPTYFEMGIKYPTLLAFNADGTPRALARIGSRTASLQPSLLVSGQTGHALMRDASDARRVQLASTRDGGQTWEDQPALDLPNYSTSVAALRLSNGAMLLLHNHVEGAGSDRNKLRLSISQDARSWRPLFDVAHGKPGEEFSYPTLRQIGDELHVTFTSRRTAIAHHVYRIVSAEAVR